MEAPELHRPLPARNSVYRLFMVFRLGGVPPMSWLLETSLSARDDA